MRRIAAFMSVSLLSGLLAVGVAAPGASAQVPFEATVTVAAGGIYVPSHLNVMVSYLASDYPTIAKASLFDEANHLYVTMTPPPPTQPDWLSYMRADFDVDITKMHDYRVLAYNAAGQVIATSNIQSYGPPQAPAALHAAARVDTSTGYVDLIDVTWNRPTLPATLAQGAEPCFYTFALHDSTGTVVATAKAKDESLPFPVTFGAPAASESYLVDQVTIHPGNYTITAQTIPCYGFNPLTPITINPPSDTSVTVGPDPGKLTLAKPKPNAVVLGRAYTVTGQLLAKSTAVTAPATTITIYTRTSTTAAWKAVATVTTGAQGTFSYTLTPTVKTTYVRAKSATTTVLKTASRTISLVTS